MEVTLESKTFLLKAKTTESQVDLGKEIVGGFINKFQGQEEVKNQENLLSKFNIHWVKNLLFSQSWESFQTWMRTGCGGRRGRGRQWSASSGICCVCNRYPPEDQKLGTHIAIRWSIWAEPQKTPFDPFWRYISPKPWCKSLLFPSKVLTPLTIPQFPVWRVWPVGKIEFGKSDKIYIKS